jgi:hypothetical protein
MYSAEDLDGLEMLEIEHSASAMRDAFYMLHSLKDMPGTQTSLTRQIRLCDLILDTLAEMSSRSADKFCNPASGTAETCNQNLLVN